MCVGRKKGGLHSDEVEKKYRRLSVENTRRARKIDTKEAYELAQSRERLIKKAFFADCKRHEKTLWK